MADITPLRVNLPLPGTQFRSAVSEFLIQSLGESINFINYFQHSEKQFFINGPYGTVVTSFPVAAVDGLVVWNFNAQLISAWMFNIVAGSSGTTELDIKVATSSGGSFSSIFTTTPKIQSTAGNNAWVGNPTQISVGGSYTPPSYTAPAHTTAPVFNTSITNSIAAYSAMRLDLISAQSGAENTGILLHYRPI